MQNAIITLALCGSVIGMATASISGEHSNGVSSAEVSRITEYIFENFVHTWFNRQSLPNTDEQSQFKSDFGHLSAAVKRRVVRLLASHVSEHVLSDMCTKRWGKLPRLREYPSQHSLLQQASVRSGGLYELDHLGNKYRLLELLARTGDCLVYSASGSDRKEYIVKYKIAGMTDVNDSEHACKDKRFMQEFLFYALTSLIPGFQISPRPMSLSPYFVFETLPEGNYPKFGSHAQQFADVGFGVQYFIVERVGVSLAKYSELSFASTNRDGRLDPISSLSFLQESLLLLRKLHVLGIIHGDIHLDNLCLKERHLSGKVSRGIVLIDYGLSSWGHLESEQYMPSPKEEVLARFLSLFQVEAKFDPSIPQIPTRRIDDVLRMLEHFAVLFHGASHSGMPRVLSDPPSEDQKAAIIHYKKSGQYYSVNSPVAAFSAFSSRINALIHSDLLGAQRIDFDRIVGVVDDGIRSIRDYLAPYSQAARSLVNIVGGSDSDPGFGLSGYFLPSMDSSERYCLLESFVTEFTASVSARRESVDPGRDGNEIIDSFRTGTFSESSAAFHIDLSNNGNIVPCPGLLDIGYHRVLCAHGEDQITRERLLFKFNLNSMYCDSKSRGSIHALDDFVLGVLGSNLFSRISPYNKPLVAFYPVFISREYTLRTAHANALRELFPGSSSMMNSALGRLISTLPQGEFFGISYLVFQGGITHTWDKYVRRSAEDTNGHRQTFPAHNMRLFVKLIVQALALLERARWLGIHVSNEDLVIHNILSDGQDAVFGSLGRSGYDPYSIPCRLQVTRLFDQIGDLWNPPQNPELRPTKPFIEECEDCEIGIDKPIAKFLNRLYSELQTDRPDDCSSMARMRSQITQHIRSIDPHRSRKSV